MSDQISALIDYLRKRWSCSENEEIVKVITTCNNIKPTNAKILQKGDEEKPHFTFQ